MRIVKLHIDRFGIWKNLALGPLASGLNVFFGQKDADRGQILEFTHAMLFGFDEDGRTLRHQPDWTGAAGSLTVSGGLGFQTVHRRQETHGAGQLVLENEDGSVLSPRRLDDLLDGASASLFDRVFIADFQQACDLAALIDAAVAHGLPVIGGHGDPSRLAPLQQRLAEQQRALQAAMAAEAPLASLLERRRRLRVDVEALQAAAEQHSERGNHRRRSLQNELVELEQQLDQLQAELVSLDEELQLRRDERQRCAEAADHSRINRQQQVVQRRQRLEEIDDQLERWRHVLRDVELRRERLQAQTDSGEPVAEGPADPRQHLRRLEEKLEALHSLVLELSPAGETAACQCRQLRSGLAPALQAMRDDIYRLCNGLSLWEENTRRSETSGESSQMKRCESELRQAIKGLALQRQRLLGELATFEPPGARLALPHRDHCRCADHSAVPPMAEACQADGLDEELLSVLDAEIERLEQRRGDLQADLEELDHDLADVRKQLESVSAEEPNPHQQRLAAKQSELERIERQICDGERRRDLQASIAQLEEEIRILEPATRSSEVLRQAAGWLRGLSLEELQQISVTPERTVHVETRRGDRLAVDQLDAARRDQVALSLRLAVVARLAAGGKRLPLLLHDVLIRQDGPHRQAAASVLCDFARRGHQVLLLLGSEEAAEVFRTREIPIRRLPDPRAVELPPVQEPAIPLGERQRLEINRRLSEIAEEVAAAPRVAEGSAFSAEEFPGELTDRVRRQTDAAAEADDAAEPRDSAHFLSENSLIDEAPSIDAATAERFRRIGVFYVRDLLQIDVADAADRLRHAGVTAGMISRWRAEALLVCRVAHLRPYDARILVACGIETPEQLGQLDADELCHRVEAFASTSIGQVLIRAGNRYELSRLTNWIRSARSAGAPRRVAGERRPAEPSRGRADRVPARPRREVARRQEPQPRTSRRPRSGRSDPPTIEAAKQLDNRRPAAAGAAGAAVPPPGSAATGAVVFRLDAEAAEPRFYLNLEDPIESAPSIGPRTAERLERIGIRSVADFLRADPQATASRLDHRYIRPETVRQWQQHASLVCRVPQLRGHDAQILVACGITRPEQLAAADPAELWSRVEPFSETTEGKRILRGGRSPDREEVHNWIRWAGQARQLRAA